MPAPHNKRPRPPRAITPERTARTRLIKANLRSWQGQVSDTAIAAACGVNPVTVRRWKHDGNDSTPQLAEAAALCEFFGRHIGELLRPLDLPEPDEKSAQLARSILGVP